jgi:hypothetical protein
MEKHILRWSYWLGVVCVALAFLIRVLNLLGVPVMLHTRGNPVSFASFADGALLFLVTAIASSGLLWFKRQNN